MKKKKYSVFSNIAFYYKRLYQYSPVTVYRQIGGIICGVLLPVFTIYLPKIMLDFVERKVSGMELIAGLGGFVLLMAAFGALSNGIIGGTFMERRFFIDYLLGWLFQKFIRVDYRYAEEEKYREKYWAALRTNWDNMWTVPEQFFEFLPKLITQTICFFLYSAIITRLHPAVLLLLVVLAVIQYALREEERRFRDRMQPKKDILFRKRMYLRNASENVNAAKDIRIFDLHGWLKGRSEAIIAKEKKLNREIDRKEVIRESVVWLLEAVRDFTAYAILIIESVRGHISLGDFVLYFGAISGFGGFLNQMIEGIQMILNGSDRACRYREYYDMPEEKEEGESTEGLKFPPSIDFCDVTFGYEEGKPVLSHFTLHIQPGEKIALVGVNGAGKTSFVKLLTGFYEPQEGKILFNGIDAGSFSKKERYKLFSAVFQETAVFPFTVGENLTLKPQEEVDEDRAVKALKDAGIWEALQEKGIDLKSYMTKYFMKDGVTLSGGQMQRFMLARALYKDAPVLILDEPTAALDPIAESEIYDAYAAMTENKTAVFISHRLASTRFSDRIVLLEKGQILESGTHEELLERKGAYAEMFALQASYYQNEEREELQDGI